MFKLAEKPHKILHSQSGFTLVELLVVVAIIAILAAVLVPKLLIATHMAREARAKADLATFRAVMDAYAADEGQGSYAKASNNLTDPKSVASVLTSKGIKWGTADGVKDPWGSPYMYSAAPHSVQTPEYIYSYAFVSAGPDRKFGTADDIWCTDDQPPLQQNSAGLWFVSGTYPQVKSNGQ